MVRSDCRDGVFHQPGFSEGCQELVDLVVRIGDFGIVARDIEGILFAFVDLQTHPRTVQALVLAALIEFEHALAVPVLVVLEEIAERFGRRVRVVGIYIMDPQEVRLVGIERGGGFEGERGDLGGVIVVFDLVGGDALPSLAVGVKALIVAELRGERAVGHHRVGGIALFAQRFGEQAIARGHGFAHPSDDVVVLRIGGGEHRRKRGARFGPLHGRLIEADPFGGKAIERRRGGAGITVGGKVVGAQGVDGDQQNITGPRPFGGLGDGVVCGRVLGPGAAEQEEKGTEGEEEEAHGQEIVAHCRGSMLAMHRDRCIASSPSKSKLVERDDLGDLFQDLVESSEMLDRVEPFCEFRGKRTVQTPSE